MKNAYPIVLAPQKKGFTVYIPDFDINTQGDDLAEAIDMAKDAIGIMGIDMEDDGEAIPAPRSIEAVHAAAGDLTSLVVVDFSEYRRRHELRVVKKNCTIPSWLNYEAEKAHINFSYVLQNALKRELHISDS